uniref:Serpin domain-containing protein n=1 Tax=Heliothis virescens TaxID=7102 RepID=A0A2A4J0U7_HELVI
MRASVICLVAFALQSVLAAKRGIVTLYGSLDSLRIDSGPCPEYANVFEGYQNAIHNFTIEVYKHVAPLGTYQFVVSSHSMWMTLAAIAEGTDYETQQQLFKILLLPENPCIRQRYYQLAASRFSLTPDVAVVSTRALVIDEGVLPNPGWHNFVTKNSLLDVISAPIKYNPPVAASVIRQVVYANFPRLNLQGNSVLLDTMDYNGLWNTAFADALVNRAPFHDTAGKRIGSVDMMTVKRRAKVGFIPSLQSKVLELPIGTDNQYSIIIALVVGNNDLRPIVSQLKSTIIKEVLATLKESRAPIDVAIPQFTINSELDARTILEDFGITNLWTDPAATRYISTPPALPSSYVQRSTLTLNKDGVNLPTVVELRSFGPSDPDDLLLSEFKADRPFMFGLFDTETYSCLMATMYTQPTYPN